MGRWPMPRPPESALHPSAPPSEGRGDIPPAAGAFVPGRSPQPLNGEVNMPATQLAPEPRVTAGTSDILVVDGVRERREAMREALASAGHRVDAVADEDRALDLLEERGHQVVVLGWPRVVGSAGDDTLLNWLRVRHPDIQIILVARPSSGDAAVRLANSGASGLVHDPVDPDALRDAVQRAAERYVRRQEARRRHEDDYVRRRHLDAMSHVFENALMQLSLVYQPIVRARTGCVVGYEAYLRTTTPRFETPAPLLDLARRLGRQFEVDDRVRSLVAIVMEETAQPRTIFVNFDSGELTRGVLATRQDPLAPYAHRIIVEFGDAGPVPEGPQVRETIDRMRRYGYRIAAGGIAGTISGLARMRVLQPDLYKLGAAVVQNCDRDPVRRRHMARLIDLAHDEGALVVAQGIERPEERQVAVELGCDMLQGFLLGMPKVSFD
ncbi:MAG: EAL domain-containing protein [Deltaproteobacteria bacterium]|nr:MAG: EAL domain-containing protein [Deltaproteobacteria bacterium]